MNELLAFNIEPGWAVALCGGIVTATAAIVRVWFKFFGDARWQKKDDAKLELEREVKLLQATDTEVKKAIEELSAKVTAQDATRGAQVSELKDGMNRGFKDITETFNKGMLLLTKEVAIMQGRLAGTNGVNKQSEN